VQFSKHGKSRIAVTLGSAALLLCHALPAKGEPTPTPEVTAQTVPQPGLKILQTNARNSSLIVVEVAGKSALGSIEVHLVVLSGETKMERGPIKVGPTQIISETFSIPRTDFPVVAHMTYSVRGTESTTSAASTPPVKTPSSLTTLLGAISGVVGVIIGAALAHFFTRRRERMRASFEWRKMLYERREPAYLDFLDSWDLSISPQIFEQQFRRLKSRAVVPTSLVEAAEALLAALNDVNRPIDQKKLETRAFRDQVASAALWADSTS
jgi:hypothetical protein